MDGKRVFSEELTLSVCVLFVVGKETEGAADGFTDALSKHTHTYDGERESTRHMERR